MSPQIQAFAVPAARTGNPDLDLDPETGAAVEIFDETTCESLIFADPADAERFSLAVDVDEIEDVLASADPARKPYPGYYTGFPDTGTAPC